MNTGIIIATVYYFKRFRLAALDGSKAIEISSFIVFAGNACSNILNHQIYMEYIKNMDKLL